MTKEIAKASTYEALPEGDFQQRLFFANGRGVSVVRHNYSYGGKSGLFESIALVGMEEDSFFDMTVLEGDAVGWQTPEDVVKYAQRIAELPPVIDSAADLEFL